MDKRRNPPPGVIDTDHFSRELRRRLIDPARRRVLVSRLAGSEQERDLRRGVNCGGLGRLHQFRCENRSGWPANPLPIAPARAALGLPPGERLVAQVFQRAGCNWRCWYCYVPDRLLTARDDQGTWLSADDLVAHYAESPDRPPVLDLSGGQPDLTPEWVPWVMEALEARGLADTTYLWSDDNLSNDYLWRFLDARQLASLAANPRYGRGGCFKGFDEASFQFNTRTRPTLFQRQLAVFERLLRLGIDLYATVSLTCASTERLTSRIKGFMDRLQTIHELLPLRTVPVEVKVFTPVQRRLTPSSRAALAHQWQAMEVWCSEIERRFPATLRDTPVQQIRLA